MSQRTSGGRNRFNSRSRGGSDDNAESYYDGKVPVSIHAPAGGATRYVGLSVPVGEFQFTLPRGERHGSGTCLAVADVFQFTLPRGERHNFATETTEALKFQFTLPRGERHATVKTRRNIAGVSIHAPAGGATPSPPRGFVA